MKYVITSYFIGKNGGIVFYPQTDVEVFDTYFGAMRWLVKERNLSRKVDDKVIVEYNQDPSPYGREWFVEMCEIHESSKTIVTLARINENGFH